VRPQHPDRRSNRPGSRADPRPSCPAQGPFHRPLRHSRRKRTGEVSKNP